VVVKVVLWLGRVLVELYAFGVAISVPTEGGVASFPGVWMFLPLVSTDQRNSLGECR
jgi:hypothetical protein